MWAAHFATSLIAISLAMGACTPASEADRVDQPMPGLSDSEARLERVLCQVSVGAFGDRTPERKNLMLLVRPGEERTSKTATIGPFKIYLEFRDDGYEELGAPQVSFGVRRKGHTDFLASDVFELAVLESGGTALPENQIGSGFTGTAYVRDPASKMTLTRYCRAFPTP